MKKTMRRFMSWLLVTVMVLGIVPTTAFADVTAYDAAATDAGESTDASVDVTFTLTQGENFYLAEETDELLMDKDITIPYFDLALYGLEDFYYNPDCYTGSVQQAGTKETAQGNITVLHLLLYITEIYKCELSIEDAGKGYLYEENLIGDLITIDQGAGSSFVHMWDIGFNMNYYVNYIYPLGGSGWGATCDQILLKDGDKVDIHAIASKTAYGSNFSFFTLNDVRDRAVVNQGETATLTLWHTQPDWVDYTTTYVTAPDEMVYYIPADAEEIDVDPRNWNELGYTDENGMITFDTSQLEAGSYYIATNGFDDLNAGVENAPAVFALTVEKSIQTEDVALSGGNVISINKDYIGTATVSGAAINNVKKIITDDGSLQYLVELSVHTPDNAEIKVDLTQTGVSGAGRGYAIKRTKVSSVGWDDNELDYVVNLEHGEGSMNAYSYYNSTSYTPLTISFYKGTTGEVYITPTEITTNDTNSGSFNGKVSQIVITNQNVTAYQWLDTWVLDVQLDENVADDAIVNLKFVTSGKVTIGLSNPYNVQLINGEAVVTLTAKGNPFGDAPRTFTIYLSNKANEAPQLAEGIEAEDTAEVNANEPFALDLSTIFVDPEGMPMTYMVSVNGETPVAAEEAFSYVQSLGGTYTLAFTANDGKKTSEPYTVTLTVNNTTVTYDVTVNVPEGIAPEFFITNGKAEDGSDLLGEALTAAAADGVYTVSVPENVTRISYRADGMGMSADVSAEQNSLSLRAVKFAIQSQNGSAIDAGQVSIKVSSEDYQVLGKGASYLLAAGETYTYEVTPESAISGTYSKVTMTDQSVEAGEDVLSVPVALNFSAPKQIIADSDAKVQMFYQSKYYVQHELTPVMIEDNGDGTSTFTFNDTRADGYGYGFSYRVSKEGCITKAGYLPKNTTPIVTWEDETDTPSTRREYDKITTYGARGDDSILVNVNSANHLVLSEGQTYRLRTFRVWGIIDSDTTNVMIEPDFNYTGYDKEMLTIVSANETLSGQVSGNAKDNWVDITANKTGTTFLEVSYDALKIVNGYGTASSGGSAGQPSNYTYNACDPNRTALVVVQVGNAATDVSFGISSFSANNTGDYYDASKAAAWDAEFDTLYFTGDCAAMNFTPGVSSGSIAEVAVSNDKGITWKVLEGNEGVYTAEIFAGNNILRVTKDNGTTAYQVVRGDKVAVTIENQTNPGEAAKPGDTVHVVYDGVHFPVGKMAGIYNPGYSGGHRITYTANGENVRAQNYQQYSFIGNAYIEITIPEDAEDSYVLTDGYIQFNIMGSAPGTHRKITDGGATMNTGAESTSYTRCILPDVVLYENEVPFEIVTQPTDTSALKGENASVYVEATGKGLSYKWYYKNPGNKKFYESGVDFVSEDGTTYTISMAAWRDGQQVYCEITDENGEVLQTNVITLTLDTGSIAIITQPVSIEAASGEQAVVTVEATGKDLTYTWYYKNPGNVKFYESGSAFVSEDGASYSIPMALWRDGQQVYCVVTDADGITVQSNTVTLTMTK